MWENELVVHQKDDMTGLLLQEKKQILPTVQKTAMLAFSNEPIFIYIYIHHYRFPYIAVGRIFLLQTHCYFIIGVGVQINGGGMGVTKTLG